MNFRVVAIGENGNTYMGEDADLSDAVSKMSECVVAAGTTEDRARLAVSLSELRAGIAALIRQLRWKRDVS